MNVELTIQDMFDSYPTLFKERTDCLNHLFCTIGNGYRWINGELIEIYHTCDMDYLQSRLINGKAHQYNKLSLRAESQRYEDEQIADGWYERFKDKYPDEDIDWLKKMRQRTIDKLPDDVYYHEPERKKRWSFYVNIPGKEYIHFSEDFAYLFNYPEDIKPDWKEAIEECRRLLIEDGFELPVKKED
jgi:hypothetical protein